MSQDTKTNEQKHDQIGDWVKDIVALESHIEEAMDHQLKIEAPTMEVNQAIQHLHDTVRDSKQRAETFAEQYGTPATGGIVKKGAELLGIAAGMIDRIRKDTASKALRDDYTAFNHAAMAYTMLHTTALATNEQAAAAFAEQGLRTYAGLVQKINHVMPVAVLDDLKENPDVPVQREQVVTQCRETIDRIWKQTSH